MTELLQRLKDWFIDTHKDQIEELRKSDEERNDRLNKALKAAETTMDDIAHKRELNIKLEYCQKEKQKVIVVSS